MGRVVMFIGILLIIAGTAGVLFGFVGVPLQFTSAINQAVTPNAATLCNAGETLDEEQGGSEYTPGQGYGRSVRYFCVNDSGVRREVTGSFVTGMFGDVFNSLGIMLIPALASCVLTVGIFLAVIGWLVSRRNTLRTVTPNNFVFPDETFVVTQSTFNPSPEERKELSAKLRQIEDARKAGLISEDEYQRLRREALSDLL